MLDQVLLAKILYVYIHDDYATEDEEAAIIEAYPEIGEWLDNGIPDEIYEVWGWEKPQIMDFDDILDSIKNKDEFTRKVMHPEPCPECASKDVRYSTTHTRIRCNNCGFIYGYDTGWN